MGVVLIVLLADAMLLCFPRCSLLVVTYLQMNTMARLPSHPLPSVIDQLMLSGPSSLYVCVQPTAPHPLFRCGPSDSQGWICRLPGARENISVSGVAPVPASTHRVS